MPICWIETYTYLSYFSIAGISVALIGMTCIFGYCFDKLATHEAVYTPVSTFDINGILGHIGVAMFVFEGNAVIMNVRAETRNKSRYPLMLKLAIVTTLSLFMVFALVSYLTYRDEVRSIFTMNLLPLTAFTVFIRICACFNALCSYPVQILAAFEIVEQNKWFKEGKIKMKKVLMRSIVVWIITGVSLMVPDFTDLLNIAGAVGSAMIAFILPPLLYISQFKGKLSKPVIAFNWFIIVLGAAGAIYSLYTSIKKFIDA